MIRFLSLTLQPKTRLLVFEKSKKMLNLLCLENIIFHDFRISILLYLYLYINLPFSSKSDHHLKPTSNLPVTFLIVQKSKALRIITKMKIRIELKKNPPKKYLNHLITYTNTASTLKMNVKIQATGCPAALRS